MNEKNDNYTDNNIFSKEFQRVSNEKEIISLGDIYFKRL